MPEGFSVDGDGGVRIGFINRILKKTFPVVHANVDGMDTTVVKQQILIAHDPPSGAPRGPDPQKERTGDHDRKREDEDSLHPFAQEHMHHPI